MKKVFTGYTSRVISHSCWTMKNWLNIVTVIDKFKKDALTRYSHVVKVRVTIEVIK